MTGIFVLLFHLSTPSSSGGMALMAAEFSSKQTCESAGKAAEKTFGGIISRPYWVCVQK